MTDTSPTWAVFTKPWPDLSAPELAELVARMGFNAIEFPLRPGFQVDHQNVGPSLETLVRIMADRGIGLASVASTPTPQVFEACAACEIPLIRVMVPVAPEGYLATGEVVRRRLDEWVPLAEKYGVSVGIQPHYDDYVADSSELASLLAEVDSPVITAIWDAAHDGLARKHPSHALALLWEWLAMANFKNACYRRTANPPDDAPPWEIAFVEGSEGLSCWREAAHYLRDHGYTGPVCLSAEYSDETDLESKVTADLRYLQTFFDGDAA